MLTYADVCRRMLTYADVCRRRTTVAVRPNGSRLLPTVKTVSVSGVSPMRPPERPILPRKRRTEERTLRRSARKKRVWTLRQEGEGAMLRVVLSARRRAGIAVGVAGISEIKLSI